MTAVWLRLAPTAVACLLFWLYLGELDSRRELLRSSAALKLSLSREIAARDAAEAGLSLERDHCDKMFLWYEYCLDERTCTSAGDDAFPSLTFWRKFPEPTFPHHRLPGIPWKEHAPSP